ncbi:flagellar basal body-associated FliL family protein [Methylobacter sp.]|uniref:flagellar basal body-associated FliL family protein n=1 Tax=Methylobacter sp. TaxID=2051955 RepID=UPI0011FB6CED|nr:flagellar basal body-associated FliL family protein [Methylobacter sp.]TAK65045.1 MAG: flagellar basal body-associated FliL family protein [Methylobacter sp.]
MRLWGVLLSLLFMSVAAANEGAKESESESGAKYIEMSPKFTVNLAEPKKLLVVNVQLLVDGEESIEVVKKHMPALRHELIMLYSGRPSDEFQTMEQREALRKETTIVIRQTLARMQGAKEHNASDEKGHSEKHKAESHSEDDKSEHKEGFKEAYFTEFLVD